jgi:putative thioredoxin
MRSDFIIHVDESDFEYEVLQYSAQVPVVVYFWAPWCVPCRVLEPKLDQLARVSEGRFRLAKLNVDENMRLARQYKVRNIPIVKAFVHGRIVAEFSGMLEEDGLRDFIRHLIPAPEDLMYNKGQNLLASGDYEGAEDAFREFLSMNPNHPEALLGLVRALLFQGVGKEALILLKNFPASSAYNTAQLLRPLAQAFSEIPDVLKESQDELEAAFINGVRLARLGNILAAMDGFLDILKKDRHFREDQVKDVFVGLLTLIGDAHPDARQYRQDLASTLF